MGWCQMTARSTYSLVSLTGTEIILVYIHISWHCCSTMPRAKPCLKTSISVTVDVQSNASVCFHPHCGSVVWDVFFRECRCLSAGRNGLRSGKILSQCWRFMGFCRSNGHLLVWPKCQSCGKRDVLGHGGLNPRRVILPWGWCSYGHTSSLRGSERSSPILNGFVGIWPGRQVSWNHW